MPDRKLALAVPLALLFMLWLIMTWCSPALAHGVEVQNKRAEAVVVHGMYDDGEPMSFVKVKVLNPAGKTHQVGNADINGFFAFVPDNPGKWTATLEDGMGHKGETIWQQGQGKAKQDQAEAKPQANDTPKWVRVIWGVSAIFWLSGLLFWWKGGNKAKRG